MATLPQANADEQGRAEAPQGCSAVILAFGEKTSGGTASVPPYAGLDGEESKFFKSKNVVPLLGVTPLEKRKGLPKYTI